MNLKIVFGGSGDRICEIRTDKSQSVDEIKYLIDELFHSNDFYTNVSIDMIYKNCILDDKKPISYYKIEENDEIWIGKIEDYLRETSNDVIVNVFVIGKESDLIYMIGKKNETVSEIIGRVKDICFDMSCVNIWDADGNRLQMVHEISDIGCRRGEIKLIISLRKEKSYSFKKCCKIHDQYIMEKYLWRFNWDVFHIFKENWHFTYKTSSIDNSVWIDMIRDLTLNIDLSAMGSGFVNSNFLFCMRISDRIFDACRDHIRWNINKWNQESYDEMIDYFLMAICAALIDHQNLRRFLANQCDRPVIDIVNDAVDYLINSTYSEEFVGKIFGFWNCFLLIPLTYDDMENIVDDMHHKYWFINLEIFGGIHSIKFPQEYDSTKQIKKTVSIKTGALFQRLYLVDASTHNILENEDYPNLYDGKYFIRNEFEKIKLKVILNGRIGINSEIVVDKGHRVDEIKYLVDELLNTNDLYTNVSIDIIYKNCILNERKTISYYKIKSNEEIWIGKIEDYLREEDIIMNVFIAGIEPEMVHIIMKRGNTIGDVLLAIQQICVCSNYTSLWDTNGVELKTDQRIEELYSIQGEYKIIMNMNDRGFEDNRIFEECCQIHDQYLIHEYFNGFYIENESESLDSINLNDSFLEEELEEEMNHFISLLQSNASKDPNFHKNLSELSKPYFNSKFLFSKKIVGHILYFLGNYLRLTVEKYEWESFSDLVGYFNIALFASVISYLHREESDGNDCDKSLMDIVNDAKHLLTDNSLEWANLIEYFGKCFLLKIADCVNIEKVIFKRQYWTIRLRTLGHVCEIRMARDIKGVKQIKKIISMKTGVHFEELHVMECGWKEEAKNDEVLDVIQGINDNYFTEVLSEKIKLRIVLNGSILNNINSEIVVDKGHRVDEIKYLVDELLNTNDLYMNVSIDMIYKNCILNERKTISYYKIESNEEIWIGKIEDYLREDDAILDVFISMGAPELFHLIVKGENTVSEIISKIHQILTGFQYSHIWNYYGFELNDNEMITKIHPDRKWNKLLISWHEDTNGCFEEVRHIYDQYLVKKFLWKINIIDSSLMSCSFIVDNMKFIKNEMNRLNSFLLSEASKESRLDEKLSDLPRPFRTSDLFFSMRMADRILDICRDLWKLSTYNYPNLINGKLIDYFHLALCIVLFDYLESKRKDENIRVIFQKNNCDAKTTFEKTLQTVSTSSGCNEKSLRDIVNDAIECLKNCEEFSRDLVKLFLKRFSFASFTDDEIENKINSDDQFIQVKIDNYDYYIQMPADITSIRQTKKEISRAFKITPKQLYLIESGGDQQLKEEDVLQVDKYLKNKYTFEFIMSMDDIEVSKTLSKGGFGEVLLCKNKITQETFIMKKPLDESDDLYRDISIHYQVGKSDEIVQYKGLYNYDGNVCLGMEYLSGGSLKSYLEKEKCLSETEVARISYEILNQIDKFHSEGVIHRDIKPENILLDDNGHAKLIDFGLAKLTNNLCDYDMILNFEQSSPGTLHYMAPEVTNDLVYTDKVDIWSFGVIVVEMITGKLPFGNLNQIAAANRIAKSKSIRYTLPKQVTKELRDFIDSCLNPNPEERLTAKELLLCPFIQNYSDNRH